MTADANDAELDASPNPVNEGDLKEIDIFLSVASQMLMIGEQRGYSKHGCAALKRAIQVIKDHKKFQTDNPVDERIEAEDFLSLFEGLCINFRAVVQHRAEHDISRSRIAFTEEMMRRFPDKYIDRDGFEQYDW